MIEDVKDTRRRHVERMNGRLATWWHYNRVTLAVLLSIVAVLNQLLYWEHATREQAEADAHTLAHFNTRMACYEPDRATSLVIAGSNQWLVDDALRTAAQQIDQVRSMWWDARLRNMEERKKK